MDPHRPLRMATPSPSSSSTRTNTSQSPHQANRGEVAGTNVPLVPQPIQPARAKPREKTPSKQRSNVNVEPDSSTGSSNKQPSSSTRGQRRSRTRGTGTRGRGGAQRGKREASGGSQKNRQAADQAAGEVEYYLMYPVLDCCTIEKSSTASKKRDPSQLGINHIDSPCIPCDDQECSATAPTPEDLFAIPMKELAEKVDQVYDFLPDQSNAAKDIEEFIDLSIYLGIHVDC